MGAARSRQPLERARLRLSKLFAFLFQWVSAGLALAFIVLVTRPELLRRLPGVTGEAGLLAHTAAASRSAATSAAPAIGSYADAVAAAAPAVVNIYSTRYVEQRLNPMLRDPLFRKFFGDRLTGPSVRTELSLGSGVILDLRGYVLTNNHVVAGADAIELALYDGRTAKGVIVGTDPETDLAVIRMDIPNPPLIATGDSNRLRVGDVVLAIGNPFGVGQTVTQGIVSATGRNRVGINTFENFIQTDAAINPGNSGGALINIRGELVGINSVIVSESGGAQGIGFAIPVNMAREVMESIIRTGGVVRGWLGIEAYDLNPELAAALGLTRTGGALVKGVVLGGAADEAGLLPNDVVTQIGEVPVRDAHQGLDVITHLKPGSSVPIDILRNGRRMTLEVVVSQRPRPENRD